MTHSFRTIIPEHQLDTSRPCRSPIVEPSLVYEIGRQQISRLDLDVHKECAFGIHFFLTFDEAREYAFWHHGRCG